MPKVEINLLKVNRITRILVELEEVIQFHLDDSWDIILKIEGVRNRGIFN